MASLKEGVLQKLLEEMKTKGNSSEKDRKAVLLQIRSIIPVLEEGDLWPNRGFILKVSDSSHALYVSLPKHQNDMILGNRLQLGQFIYVQKLEDSDPLPLLRGVVPIPGRRPCEGTPHDIVSPARLLKLLPPMEKKFSRGPSVSRTFVRGGASDTESCSGAIERPQVGVMMTRSSSASQTRGDNLFPRVLDNDSDADSVGSTRVSKRRSWSESEILGVKEIFDSSFVKHESRTPSRSTSTNVSPTRSTRYDSSDDNSSIVSRSRVSTSSAKRMIRSELPATKARNPKMSSSPSHLLCNVVCVRKGAESRVSWTSLPPDLVNHGKEVIKQRDIALQAAADALQEACASERLLNSLSTMPQFLLADGEDLEPFMDKFFNLQHDLAQTRLIMQSLNPTIMQEAASCTTTSVEEMLSIAQERKKNANAWIKSAMALDLSPCLSPLTSPPDPTRTPKQSSSSSPCAKQRAACSIKRNRDNIETGVEIPMVVDFDKENPPKWSRGSSLWAAGELASSLQEECKKVFLVYADRYLDEVDRKSGVGQYDEEMAGMMYKVKMVSEWVNVIGKKEGCESEGVRVRDKIYAILLKHVEMTAMAFDRFKPSI